MDKLKDIIANSLLIAFAGWFLYHLVLFWIYDWIVVGEPSKPILVLEIMIGLGMIGLGIDRLRSHWK